MASKLVDESKNYENSDDENSLQESFAKQEETPPKCSVFLSYQWKTQPVVRQIYNELATHDCLEIFMDIFKLKAGMNLYLTLASNIQNADVVLACVTREYVKSKNCEREIIYADSFNKHIIPLYMEKIPMAELGSIGFILVRERYCNLYKNEKLFENLSDSNEFKDILDGIHSYYTKTKGLSIDMFKKSIKDTKIDTDKIDDSVISFRSDAKFGATLTENNIEKTVKDNNVPTTKPKTSNTTISTDRKNDVVSKFQSIPATVPKKKTTSQDKDFTSSKKTPEIVKHSPLEMHPVIQELKFLYTPKVWLMPTGDRFEIISKQDYRGGEVYNRPVGWIRYALKIQNCYPNPNIWLNSDGNSNEWAVAYLGFKISPLRSLYSRLFRNGVLDPFIENSKQLKYVNLEDINPKSLRFGELCNIGIICTPKPEEAEKHTPEFIVKDLKYKMLLQCRVNPKRIRIPKGTKDLYIINNSKNIRPYGLLIKQVG